MAELTNAEKQQKEINRKLANTLVKADLPLKIKYNVKGKDSEIFYSLIPYSAYEQSYYKGVKLSDLNPQKRQLKYGDIFEVVDVSPFNSSLFITKDGLGIKKGALSTWFDLIEDKPIPTKEINKTTSNTKLEQDLNNSPLGKTARKVQIGFSVVAWGVFGVLAYKFWNKSTTWKVMLSVFGAYNLYNTYKVFNKPALKVSEGSDSNTQIETGTETGGLDKSNDKLTKQEKIDLIIKIQRGNQPADEDSENNTITFLNTLNDADLSIWIPLSKALKDEQVNSAMAKNIDEGFKLVESKYGITRKQAEEQNKKLAQFFATIFESAGFKSTENKSMFSNFESSLNLDI